MPPSFYVYSRGFHLTVDSKFYFFIIPTFSSVQFSSVTQSCPTLCDPMNCSTPGLPVHRQLPEFTQTHVHRVSDAIQPSHPLSSPSPPAPNPSQHQSLFQWVNSSHEVAKVLELEVLYFWFWDSLSRGYSTLWTRSFVLSSISGSHFSILCNSGIYSYLNPYWNRTSCL